MDEMAEGELPQDGMRRFSKLGAISAVTAVAGAGVLLFALNPSQGTAAPVAAAPAAKYWVCKYVGTPGVDERLQTGNNPIDVSGNAIKEDPVVVGSFFNDKQGRSFVLALAPKGSPKPPKSACPAAASSSTPPPSTSSSVGVSPTESTSPPVTTVTATVLPGTSAAGPEPSSVAAGLHTPVSGDTAAVGGALMALGLGGLLTAVRPWKRGAH